MDTCFRGATVQRESKEGYPHRETQVKGPIQSLSTSDTNTEGVIRTSGIWEWFSLCPEANSNPGECGPDESCLTGSLED